MRRLLLPLTSVLALALAAPAAGAAENEAAQGGASEYVVVYDEGATDAARAAIAASGGEIVRENTEIGVATVRSGDAAFESAIATQAGVGGVAHNTIIGTAGGGGGHERSAARDAVEKAGREALTDAEAQADFQQRRAHGRGPEAEPLADLQWDMQQINATADGSYRVERGDERVLVGIIDTGIDGSHPDIAPNFARDLSRNFTVDIPTDANGERIDGPCEEEPDKSCNDPADVDEDGHGTHVASTIGAPINGIGIAGVAPDVTLVNLRAGQDSGYFFLQATVDALTYAGDIGVDVVNMSYYVDPWLFNCTDNQRDNAANRREQQAIITAVQRALDYAHRKGVTLISSAGNEAIDYTKPQVDETSPDFASVPGEAPYARDVDPSCVSLPSEGNHVIPVSATGPSTRKSYYSSFGQGYVEVAAPGGDAYDTPDGSRDITGVVLAAYPYAIGVELGDIDPVTGEPTNEFVVRDCANGTCAYYQYLQGTSMASPHAVGVAALIVSKYGHGDGSGYGLSPFFTEFVLRLTATRHVCPEPNPFTYVRFVPQADGTILRVESEPQTCEEGWLSNGFYGSGIVDALRAVRPGH